MALLKLENKSPLNKLIQFHHQIVSMNNILKNSFNKKIYNINKTLSIYESMVIVKNPHNLIKSYKIRLQNSNKALLSNISLKLFNYNQDNIILRKKYKKYSIE